MLSEKEKQTMQPGQGPSELEELSKLTGHLAHEIKNPLSTIKVNLKLSAQRSPTALPDGSRPNHKNTYDARPHHTARHNGGSCCAAARRTAQSNQDCPEDSWPSHNTRRNTGVLHRAAVFFWGALKKVSQRLRC